MSSLVSALHHRFGRLSRRDLFRKTGILAVPELLHAAPANTGLQVGPDIYQSIGVRPIINCRGTITVVGGSLELPEVRAAKDAAARHFVQIDEMMEGISNRLAQLTGAESGIVTSGCAAALAHATAACLAGGDPDRHVKIPDLAGFSKDEVIIPTHSRNEYDAAVRSVGVRIIEVADAAQYEAALGPRVAMVYVLAGPRAESGPLSYDPIYELAKKRNVPVLVDAAAEDLTIPNVHLQRGATLVGYSGGKALRGPQCAGLLLGRKDLVKAAWVHSAPHHGYGRSMKVGKEEAMGMLAAVEAWVKRDHEAEYKTWTSWLNNIARIVSTVDGVTASIREPRGLSNHTPGLNIRWDTSRIGISGEEVSKILFTTEPRIALAGGGGAPNSTSPSAAETGVSIAAWMMCPGEDQIVGNRLREVIGGASGKKLPVDTTPADFDISGEWEVRIEFAAGTATHSFFLRSDGGRIEGTHSGEYVSRDMFGSVYGNRVKLSSDTTEAHGERLAYTFTGTLNAQTMSGDLDMGEYLGAKWTATRHNFRGAGRA